MFKNVGNKISIRKEVEAKLKRFQNKIERSIDKRDVLRSMNLT